jgi:acyl-homoserine-lactone acylase
VPADVLAHLQRAIHFTFLSSPGRAARELGAGSNAWAIAPSRSASGNALLLANPHLPWADLFTWFEAHLVAPGLDAYGVTFVGLPFLGIAFNDRLGWSHTVNPIDAADVYELALVEGGYRWDGGTRAFETRTDMIRIREADGTMRVEPFPVLASVHGPVIARDGSRAWAIRVAGLDQPHLFGQYWEMAHATDLASFEAALARLQMPMFNTIYADRDGHVLYVFGGRVPVRSGGAWEEWAGIVRGDTSATLWTATHPYADLPRVLDPPAGWVQNANDPPWTATIPTLDPGRYPGYLAPLRMELRPQRSIRMLLADSSITLDEMIGYKHETRVELADRILDDLVPAARARGGAAARAAEVLAAWDRRADAGSRGAVLFAAFVHGLAGDGPIERALAVPWSLERPLDTPDGLADPAAAVDALVAAAARLEASSLPLDVPWGAVNRLRRDSLDLPGNGAGDPLGVFRNAAYAPDEDGRGRAVYGDTYVAAIEFGVPPRAMALLSYGNWSRPGSAHRTDQLPLFAEQRLRPVWRARAEVEAHLERRETLP